MCTHPTAINSFSQLHLFPVATVYPSLSKEQKNEWEEIERDYYREELTFQGYNKHRNKLFMKAGFIPTPNDSNDKQEGDNVVEDLVNGERSNEKSQQNKRFHSFYQCTKVGIHWCID